MKPNFLILFLGIQTTPTTFTFTKYVSSQQLHDVEKKRKQHKTKQRKTREKKKERERDSVEAV